MIEQYIFKIDGEPVAKGRPRFVVRGKFVQTYTPAKTKGAEKAIIAQLKKQYKKAPLNGPCNVTMRFAFSIPKSYSKKKREEIEKANMAHTIKPDCDNICKLVSDAMNGLIYEDDCLVNELHIYKSYTFGEPYTEIEITGVRKDLTK